MNTISTRKRFFSRQHLFPSRQPLHVCLLTCFSSPSPLLPPSPPHLTALAGQSLPVSICSVFGCLAVSVSSVRYLFICFVVVVFNFFSFLLFTATVLKVMIHSAEISLNIIILRNSTSQKCSYCT